MPQYLTPGVYIEEVPDPPRPIEGVGTNVAAFVGALVDSGAPTGIPTAVDNWTQYTNLFASEGPSSALTLAVHGFFLNGGRRCYVDLHTPDYAQLSASLGLGHTRVKDLKELPAALDRAQSTSGPFILEIDMLSIGSFKTAFAGPPTKLAQPS